MDAQSPTPFPEDAISADAPLFEAIPFDGAEVRGSTPERRRSDLRLPSPGRKWLIGVLLVGSHLLCGLVGFLLARSLAGGSSDESTWAREVAEHFLEAFVNENTVAAKAVSTRQYQQVITGITTTGGPLRWSITSDVVNERSGQASFKGIIVGQVADPRRNKRSFTLLMEKEDGRWKVSSFTLGALQQ